MLVSNSNVVLKSFPPELTTDGSSGVCVGTTEN